MEESTDLPRNASWRQIAWHASPNRVENAEEIRAVIRDRIRE
jgi:hypothetical protein